MAKTFESKGKEGRWGSGGVVEAEGGDRGLFIGVRNGEHGRRRWW
jgi:hypothetical protein